MRRTRAFQLLSPALLLLASAALSGCFSDVKRKDAGGQFEDAGAAGGSGGGSGGAQTAVDAPLGGSGSGGANGDAFLDVPAAGGATTADAALEGPPPPPCLSAKDGTACGEGMVCNKAQCVPCAAGASCQLSVPCRKGVLSCATGTSVCVEDGNAPDGTGCGGGNVCRAGACSACVGGQECPLPDKPCRKGILTCSAGVSTCTDDGAKPDLTPCDDGSACTTGESCHAGACSGGDIKSCTASDLCHLAGVCDPATGACSNPVGNQGGACNDGDPCTQTDRCDNGQCVGSNPVVCAASDVCHGVGECDRATGICSNPVANEGGTCNDQNECTRTDKCQSGQCVGSNPVVCAALDACHAVGTCNTATGTCTNPVGNLGVACTLSDPCKKQGQCQADGSCMGVSICDAPGPCRTTQGATCAAGACAYPSVGDGTRDLLKCPEGKTVCRAGECKQCTADSHCSGNPNGTRCDPSSDYNCVQCTSNTHCGLPRPSCSASRQCVCRIKHPDNLLKDPGFDGSTDWNLGPATLLADDIEGCPESYAMRTGGGPDPYQCVVVGGGVPFWFGGMFRGWAGGYIYARFYANKTCSGENFGSPDVLVGV